MGGVQFSSKRSLSPRLLQRIRLPSKLQPFCFLPPFGKNSVCPFVWLAPMPSRLVCMTSTYAASPGSKRNRRSFFLKRSPAGSKAVKKTKLITLDKYNKEALLYRTCKLLLTWSNQKKQLFNFWHMVSTACICSRKERKKWLTDRLTDRLTG